MTRVVIIEHEGEGKCELCGEVAELRPYGPNGENICFICGMKDEPTTRKQFYKFIGLDEAPETQH